MTREYVYSGKGIATEFNVSGSTETVKYSNVYAGGKMIATYQGTTATQFNFTDWLGTKRVETNYQGVVTSTSNSLPFGDYLAVSGTDTNENHFTGKEHDAESNLDYFGARYYNSSFGRFMSPDWSSGAESVPYAKLDDPQSLNLYAYVRNNPLTGIDIEGHDVKPMHYDQLMNESAASWQEQLDVDRSRADQQNHQTQQQMSLSQQGLDFIKSYEKFRPTPYTDGDPNNQTIGYGHKILPGENFTSISETEASALLVKDLSGSVAAVNSHLKVGASQQQFDALVSMTINAGTAILGPTSTIMRKINAGQAGGLTEAQFTAWNKSRKRDHSLFVVPGLTNRRKDEYEMFMTGDYRRNH